MISPNEFTNWQSLKSFEDKYNQFVRERREPPRDVWATDSSHAFREGFAAIRCARNIGARSLRINPEDAKEPDIDIKLRSGGVISFQETIADLEGRQMAKEHRDWAAAGRAPRPDPVKDWWARRQEVGPAITRAIDLKSAKKYPPQTRLLIYLNLGTYETWRDEIEADIVRFSAPGLQWFASVWVLWEGRLYRAAPNPFLGTPGTFRPNPTIRLGRWRDHSSMKKVLAEEFGRLGLR
jgi:hypothetical protein